MRARRYRPRASRTASATAQNARTGRAQRIQAAGTRAATAAPTAPTVRNRPRSARTWPVGPGRTAVASPSSSPSWVPGRVEGQVTRASRGAATSPRSGRWSTDAWATARTPPPGTVQARTAQRAATAACSQGTTTRRSANRPSVRASSLVPSFIAGIRPPGWMR
ncbi:hypothetical protein GCM10010129_24180 [Streptomyces fumigatiscleroticus]|nr:hypothetical protein GCM10010129_24180 [Streptomyces fumigatiscleroticus]